MKEQNNALTAEAKALLEKSYPWDKISDDNLSKKVLIEFAVEFANAKLIAVLNQVKEEKTGMFEQTCGISRMDYILGFDEAIERIEELTLKTK